MTYPVAPWTLQGYAIAQLHLTDIDTVRGLVPPELEIVSVLPGKTVGGVYCGYYSSGSTLEYSELIVVPAIVRRSLQVGGWISAIYVDNPDSVAGGREIWGLPKELAQFNWELSQKAEYQHCVSVYQESNSLCQIHYNTPDWKFPLALSAPVFSAKGGKIMIFNGQLKSQVGLVSSQLEFAAESPLADVGLKQPWLSGYSPDLHFVAHPPV